MQGAPLSSFTNIKQFTNPPVDPILTTGSAISWGYNILTLGIYPAVTTVIKEYEIGHLKLVQQDLEKKVSGLEAEWDNLEQDLTNLLKEVNSFSESHNRNSKLLKGKVHQLLMDKSNLEEKKITSPYAGAVKFGNSAFVMMTIVGQLIANILTLGLYGVYKNYALKNRAIFLRSENHFIKNRFEAQVKEKSTRLEKVVDCINACIVLKTQNQLVEQTLEEIKGTDQAKAYMAVQQAQQNLNALIIKQNEAQQAITALKAQNLVVESEKQSALTQLATGKQEIQKLFEVIDVEKLKVIELTTIRTSLNQLLTQKQSELQVAKSAFPILQNQLKAAQAKAAQVQQLENEIGKIKLAQHHQPQIVKLAPELGPIPPKYTPGPNEKELLGAMDVSGGGLSIDPDYVNFAELYNMRYGDKRSAVEVIQASFAYACDRLFDLAEAGQIQLNKSGDTPSTPGMFAVYRFMALDLIRGGKISSNGCEGLKLELNENVSMLPSRSEKILQYKPDVETQFKPVVQFRYKQRDDFTPQESVLDLRDGVDAVSVRWILEQLDDEEKAMLFTHLMAPVIGSDHPDWIQMRTFMTNQDNPRVKLVETASELIQDLATAFQKKFGATVLVPLYLERFDDWDVQPFVKSEDDQRGLDKVKDIGLVQSRNGQKIVKWELDLDVLGDKRQYDHNYRQQDFCQLMTSSCETYRNVFSQMHEVLLNPLEPGKELKKVGWNEINEQYHVTHQMIGVDFEGNGGERCLFSNLLAVLVKDKKCLTKNNVQKLKNAMANYLDKLGRAELQWSIHSEKNKSLPLLSPEAVKLKELAELAKDFKKAITNTHHCNIDQYKNWLRNDPYNRAPINVGDLTPLEIQIAAFTIGVSIGVLPIGQDVISKVDQFGRILPEGSIFGPNTKEIFLMGVNLVGTNNGTYYGLFPKLKYNMDASIDEIGVIAELEDYWESIKP